MDYPQGFNCTTVDAIPDIDTDTEEDSFDYYNIHHRITIMLHQPHEVIAIVFGTICILLNVVILMALYKVQNRITTHYRLIISLAVSDMLVGGSVLLFKVNKAFNPTYRDGDGPYWARLTSKCAFLFIKALNTTGLNITLMNLMTMAFDHYIAIMKPLQYPVIMTKARVVCAIVIMWVIALMLGFSDFFSAIVVYSKFQAQYNYCEVVLQTLYQDEFTVFANAPICLGIMIFIYTRIYMKVLRRRQPGLEESISGGRRENRRTGKALITTLLNIGTFVLAWLPLCLFEVSMLVIAKTDPQYLRNPSNQTTMLLANQHLYNLLIFNAIADPIIYTVRMKEVRIGFMRMCACCFCLPTCQKHTVPSTSVSAMHSLKVVRRSPSPTSIGEPKAREMTTKPCSEQLLSEPELNNIHINHVHDLIVVQE